MSARRGGIIGYAQADLTICRGEYGYDHGLCWGLWRGGSLIHTASTMRSLKRIAKTEFGASPDAWKRDSQPIVTVEP